MKKYILILLFFLPYLSPAQSLDWQVQDVSFVEGDTVKVPFQVSGFKSITAYQFAIRYDTNYLHLTRLELPDPTPVTMSNLDAGFFAEFGDTIYFPDCITGDFGLCTEGEIRTVWTNPWGDTCADGTTLFTFFFVAQQAGQLSEVMALAPDVLPNAAWYFPIVGIPLTFSFFLPAETTATESPTPAETVRIYPNPASDAITIECDAPVLVEIFTSTGTLTHRNTVQNGDFLDLAKGANLVRITDGKNVILKTVFRL